MNSSLFQKGFSSVYVAGQRATLGSVNPPDSIPEVGYWDVFATEAFLLLGIGIVFVGLRMVARVITVGFRDLCLDDYLMMVAGVS